MRPRWLISEYFFDRDWPTWEMHPNGEEFVYLLSGEVQLHLEHDDAVRLTLLTGSAASIVRRGVRHTAKVIAPARILHITRGMGTQTRPI